MRLMATDPTEKPAPAPADPSEQTPKVEPVDPVAEDDDEAVGKSAGPVPVEKWMPHPVSDSADYLEGKPPRYVSDLSPAEKELFEAALSERQKKLAGHTPRSGSKRGSK